MSCDFCKTITKEIEGYVIYEDELCAAMLNPNPAVPGHITIVPKEHSPIIEQVPDETVARMFIVANKMSTIAFEILGAKGTNILVQNGLSAGQDVAHASIHVIPRQENDQIDLQWELKEAQKNELDDAEFMLKEETKNIIDGKQKEPEPPREISSSGETVKSEEGETDYMLEHLNRMP
jgi:histidine triad (HIT) family protein